MKKEWNDPEMMELGVENTEYDAANSNTKTQCWWGKQS